MFPHVDVAGVNRFRISDYVSKLKLKPGAYRLRAIPRNARGAGPTVYAAFRISASQTPKR